MKNDEEKFLDRLREILLPEAQHGTFQGGQIITCHTKGTYSYFVSGRNNVNVWLESRNVPGRRVLLSSTMVRRGGSPVTVSDQGNVYLEVGDRISSDGYHLTMTRVAN